MWSKMLNLFTHGRFYDNMRLVKYIANKKILIVRYSLGTR